MRASIALALIVSSIGCHRDAGVCQLAAEDLERFLHAMDRGCRDGASYVRMVRHRTVMFRCSPSCTTYPLTERVRSRRDIVRMADEPDRQGRGCP
jgi:hypothetical protein